MNEDLETHLKLLNGELLPDNKETLYIFELFRIELKKEIAKSNIYIKEILLKYELRDDCIINFDREQKAINIIGVDSFKLGDLLLDEEIDIFTKIESQSIAFSTLGFLYAVRSLFFLYFDQLQQALNYYTVAIQYLNTGEVLRHKDEMLLGEVVNIHNKGGQAMTNKSELAKRQVFEIYDNRFKNPDLTSKQKSTKAQFAKYITNNPELIKDKNGNTLLKTNGEAWYTAEATINKLLIDRKK